MQIRRHRGDAASRDPAGDLGEVRDALHHERSDDTGPPADRANPPGSADTRPGGGLPEGNGGRGESPWCRTAVRHHRAHHMAFFDQVPYEVKSSMLQDLEGGRHLEVSWLSGAVARLGAERGIATPVHQ